MGYFKDNLLNGLGILNTTFPINNKYTGYFQNDHYHGLGILEFPDKSRIEYGEF